MAKEEILLVGGGIAAAIALFFLTPFFPFDELAALAAVIFYGISKLAK